MTITYSVKSGDTLSALSRRFGVSVSALAKTNDIKNPDKISVGQRLVIPDGFDPPPAAKPSGTSGSAGASGSAGTSTSGSADGTPKYRQGDPRWGSRTLGTSSSIGAAGCAMTATAMAISKISGKAIDPGKLDAYLDKNHGYSGNALSWDVAAGAAGLDASKSKWSLSTINKQLDAGRPVVVGVDYKSGSGGGANGTDHWITLTGHSTKSGKDVYTANDPATGKEITLTATNGKLVGGPKGYKTTGELVTFSGGNPKPVTDKPVTDKPVADPKPSASVKGLPLPAGDLAKGSKGTGVKELQTALVKLGHMTQAEMNTGPGVFGARTQKALKEFQAANGVPATGNYGPLTRAAFAKLGASVGNGAPTTGTKPPVGGAAPVTGPIPKTGNAFIDGVAADAIESQKATGVPASVTLAQAILESGWGKSGLATKGKNYFGIKGEGPAGHVTMPTKEYLNGKWVTVDANFRKYDSAAQSFTDHGNFLRTNKRYATAFTHKNDAAQFAKDLQKAGYATDPAYADKLISLINKYGLERFDQLGRS